MNTYYIQDVAIQCHIPKSKLRYYEKHGLLQNIQRDRNNKRLYTDKDVEVIKIILCFTNLNIPLKQIKIDIERITSQTMTVNDILLAHLKVLKAEREKIDKRIHAIEGELEDNQLVASNDN